MPRPNKRALAALTVLLAIFRPGTAGASAADDRIIVVFDETVVVASNGKSTNYASLNALLQTYDVQKLRRLKAVGGDRPALENLYRLQRTWLVDTRDPVDTAAMALDFRDDPQVEIAELDGVGNGGITLASDPGFTEQWHHQNLGTYEGSTTGCDLKSPDGWDVTTGATWPVIAVLDSGIEHSHPEFAGRIVPGWDFVANDSLAEAVHDHGSVTTGLAAAAANNGWAGAGVCWNCRIMPIKVLDSNNFGYTSALIDGVTWAANNGADVINMSLVNFPSSTTLENALAYARSRGVTLVAAAGNNGIGDANVSYPGASPSVISVGATDWADARASWSATGSALDLVAPGKNVLVNDRPPTVNTMRMVNGTSMSAPIVTGLVGLMLSEDPTLSPDMVQQRLQSTADDGVGSPSEDTAGFDPYHGWGRVNLVRTLTGLRLAPASHGVVTPASAIVGSVFSYKVIYFDREELPPSRVQAFADGVLLGDMAVDAQGPAAYRDGLLANGEQFAIATTYAVQGDHTFHFEVDNALGSFRFPEGGFLSGPVVREPTNDFASSETTIAGTLTGSYTSTLAADGVLEQIREVLSSGSSSKQYSWLENRWLVNVSGGNTVRFHVRAKKSPTVSETEDYVFAWSANNQTFTNMVTVNSTTLNTYSFTLPATLKGPVYIRATDTNRVRGKKVLDSLYVDELYIRSE